MMKKLLLGVNLDEDSRKALNSGRGRHVIENANGFTSVLFQYDNGNVVRYRTDTRQDIGFPLSKPYTTKEGYFDSFKGVGKAGKKNTFLIDKLDFNSQKYAKRIDKNEVVPILKRNIVKYIPKEDRDHAEIALMTLFGLESGYRAKAESGVQGAMGIGQLTQKVREHYKVYNGTDVEQSIKGSVQLYMDLYKAARKKAKERGGNYTNLDVMNSVIRAYNGGWGYMSKDTFDKSNKGLRSDGADETEEYARRFKEVFLSNSMIQRIPPKSMTDEEVDIANEKISNIRQVLQGYNYNVSEYNQWLMQKVK